MSRVRAGGEKAAAGSGVAADRGLATAASKRMPADAGQALSTSGGVSAEAEAQPGVADSGRLSASTVDQVESYLAVLVAALRLDGWKVTVSPEPAEDDAVAQVDAPWAQRRASIRIGESFWEADAEDMRDTLVHELLHLVLMPAWQFVEELLDDEMSTKVSRVAWLCFTQHMEYSIDQLSAAISPSVPLPSFAPPGGRDAES